MNVFDAMCWMQREEQRAYKERLRKKLFEESVGSEEEFRKALSAFETEAYANAAKEHLRASGQDASDERVEKMADELANAIKKKTLEWKKPCFEAININDEEQIDELRRSFDLYMHDVLEHLGYGSYDPE